VSGFQVFLSIETSRPFSSLGLDPNSKSSPSRDASYRLSFRVRLRVRFHTAFWLLNTHQKIRSLFRRLSRKTQCATGTKDIRVNAPFKTIDIYVLTLQDYVTMNKFQLTIVSIVSATYGIYLVTLTAEKMTCVNRSYLG
jgi:hypothetical protein